MMVNGCATYGKLYNWYAVMVLPEDATPTAANIAARKELAQRLARSQMGNGALFTFLDQAGGKMKETGLAHWKSPNEDTNSSGLQVLRVS
jgi:hypothetical protein